jgi:hypothetical protein
MSKVVKFYDKLSDVLQKVSTVDAKLIIGDSINNHRTLTVNQVIRYLEEGGVRGGKKLANNLSLSYEILRPVILDYRNNNRTDAIDINEFFDSYAAFVLNGDVTTKRSVGSQLSI